MLSDAAKDKLAQLQRAYQASFKDKREEMLQCWRAVEDHDWSPASMKDLQGAAHRLAGSAASYGFEALSETASALESALSDEAVLDEARKQLVGERVQRLAATLGAESQDTTP